MSINWRAAEWTPISHSSNRICTYRTETGVAAANGTSATPSHGTSRQTSHISVAGDVADVNVEVDVDVADATSVHG